MKHIKILVAIISCGILLSLFGVSKIVSGADVIGKVSIGDTGASSSTTTTEEFTGETVYFYEDIDFNKDRKCNTDDALYLLMNYMYPSTYPIEDDVEKDLNADGVFNEKDAVQYLMYVNFSKYYTVNQPTTEYFDESE